MKNELTILKQLKEVIQSQLNGYLESREQRNGYLVSFSFLKNKEYTAGYVDDVKNDEAAGIEGKEIYEVTV